MYFGHQRQTPKKLIQKLIQDQRQKNNLFKVGQEKFRPSFLLTSKVKNFVPLGNVKRRKIGFDIDREVGNFYKFQKLKIHN